MNKKTPKTITAIRAARELGVSRETVFTLARLGAIRRAGYKVRHNKRVTLFNTGDVLHEKNRRDALRKLSLHKDGKLPTLPEKRATGGQRTAGTGQGAETPATQTTTLTLYEEIEEAIKKDKAAINRKKAEAHGDTMRTAWLVALGAIIAIVAIFAVGTLAKNAVSPQGGGAATERTLTK